MALQVIDKKMKRYIKVELVEPITVTTKEHFGWSSSFTSYLIHIETNHWAFSLPFSEVRRRFSEFCWLRGKLQQHHPNKEVPPLPPRRFVHMTKFDPKVIEERRTGLAKFLQRIMRSDELLSDSALHLFLQSNMTTAEIDKHLAEQMQGKGKSIRRSLSVPHYLRSHSTGSTVSDGDPDHEHDTDHDQTHDEGYNDSSLSNKKFTVGFDESNASTASTQSHESLSDVDPLDFDLA